MWLTMMIDHHQGAVVMAEAELAEGADTEARTLAKDIIDAQQACPAPGETARVLQQQRYGLDGYRANPWPFP